VQPIEFELGGGDQDLDRLHDHAGDGTDGIGDGGVFGDQQWGAQPFRHLRIIALYGRADRDQRQGQAILDLEQL
jgi:hypothetical protein